MSVRPIRPLLQTELGILSYRAAKKLFLTQKLRTKHTFFCKKYIIWTGDDKNKVLFSDESTFLTFKTCSKRIRCPKESGRLNQKHILKTMKHFSSPIVWGCFSYIWISNMHFLPNKTVMNSVRYVRMLQNKYPTAMKDLNASIFMQEGVPSHNLKSVKN